MRKFLTGLAALVFAAPAYCASLDDVPAPLRKTAECMLGVLKAVPGVDQARLGVFGSDDRGRPFLFLEYRFTEKNGHAMTIRFSAFKSHDKSGRQFYRFDTTLPGLGSAQGPDDWGTGKVRQSWDAQCGVGTTVLFE